MIVNTQVDGWEIIYHRAHALLAAQIAAHWNQEDSPQRLTDTIAAISHHDDLEREWDKEDLLSPAGAPKDFTQEKKTSVEKLRHHIEEALYRGRWVALLTSIHTCFLKESSQDKSPELIEFLQNQRDLQEQWRQELGIEQEEVQSSYRFMRWCDRLSLILCQHQIPDNERTLEINVGPDGQKYEIAQSQDGTISVFPWCFAKDKITVYVETSHLSELKFKDNESLKSALKTAPRKYQEWTLVKSD
ncbi:MAG: hypothetical protein RLZZ04_1092 [Cyanobacteriota bacterium]|jgi:hypothetical protein